MALNTYLLHENVISAHVKLIMFIAVPIFGTTPTEVLILKEQFECR